MVSTRSRTRPGKGRRSKVASPQILEGRSMGIFCVVHLGIHKAARHALQPTGPRSCGCESRHRCVRHLASCKIVWNNFRILIVWQIRHLYMHANHLKIASEIWFALPTAAGPFGPLCSIASGVPRRTTVCSVPFRHSQQALQYHFAVGRYQALNGCTSFALHLTGVEWSGGEDTDNCRQTLFILSHLSTLHLYPRPCVCFAQIRRELGNTKAAYGLPGCGVSIPHAACFGWHI